MENKPSKALIEEYDRTLQFLRLMFAVERKLAQQRDDKEDELLYANKFHDSWREGKATFSSALEALRQACGDYLERTRSVYGYFLTPYDNICREYDVPTITEMRLHYFIPGIFERGRIEDMKERDIVRSLIRRGTDALKMSEAEYERLLHILRDFEHPDTGTAPYVRGGIFAVPLPNGKYGAIALTESGKHFKFVVFDGFWDKQPTAEEVTKIGFVYRIGSTPDSQIAWRGYIKPPFPDEFIYLGSRVFSEPELDEFLVLSGTQLFGEAPAFVEALFREWRSRFDVEAYQAECLALQAKYEEEEQKQQVSLTLKAMAREYPFSHWREHWSRAVSARANKIVREAARQLILLEDSAGTAAEKASVLKHAIDNFNDLHQETGCMETGEREEVVEWISQLGARVGLSNEDERLTGHRTW